MPIISHNKSQPWIQKNVFSIDEKNAKEQDIRPLRIGFVNYMPDKAFIATEQDFILPIIEASGILQFEVIFFKEHSLPRSKEIQEYINSHYKEVTPELLQQCDIFIQSGYNEVLENGDSVDFKKSTIAQEVLKNYQLAKENGVTTQIASCAASQVIASCIYNISVERITTNKTPKKLLGVYPHSVTKLGEENFITKNLNSEFTVVFARNHRLNSEEINNHETLQPLITSVEKIENQNETHLFYDPKELFFGFQGHPEYQKFAILKEYLRDIGIYYKNPQNISFPEIPPNYFTKKGYKQMQDFTEKIKASAILREQHKQFILENITNIDNIQNLNNKALLEKLLKEFDNTNRPRIADSIYDEIIQSWKDTGDKIWARIFNATYQLTGYKPGQKLTQKRGIDSYKHPLDALI